MITHPGKLDDGIGNHTDAPSHMTASHSDRKQIIRPEAWKIIETTTTLSRTPPNFVGQTESHADFRKDVSVIYEYGASADVYIA
ncbi:unnamed protein product [Rhizoctonia solani]|nr:unnamed protein product [Rhizoctonia solani]